MPIINTLYTYIPKKKRNKEKKINKMQMKQKMQFRERYMKSNTKKKI